MEAWGFSYTTHAVWDKRRIGMGYWFRGRHELVLLGKRGRPAPPAQTSRIASVIAAPRGRHSEKPSELADHIDEAFPTESKLELFARSQRPGWASWGNEA